MPVTYLDYAATSPLLPEVIDAMHLAEEKFFANASALHTPGHLAMNEIEKTRRRVNALEYRMIPESNKTIKFISNKIDENDREALVRIIKVKDNIKYK